MHLEVRAARADDADYAAFLQFWRELGGAQASPPRARFDEHLAPSTLFLEAADGRLAAYGLSFPFGARGDVRQIVVAPEFRGRGVGRQIMAAVATRLRAAGCTDWRLEVKATNAAAVALYTAVGMRVLRHMCTIHFTREAAEHFAASRSGRHAVTEVSADDDAALEASHDLGRGQIARWRTIRPHCPLVRVGDAGLAQIWHDFAPNTGLLFPFRAPDADVAAHLVAAVSPMPERLEAEVGDAAIADALVACGAARDDLVFEMGGTL